MPRTARSTGLETRHQRSCPAHRGGRCACTPTYRAIVYDKRTGRRLQRSFATRSAAELWREDARVDLRRGVLAAAEPITVRQIGDAFLAGIRDGSIRNRSGERYKPKTIRGYEQALRDHIYPDLATRKLASLHRNDVQDLVSRMAARGAEPSTLRNAVMPLRAICRRAKARGEIYINPTEGLELPALRGRRDRIAPPEEAAALLAVLPRQDQPIWATAMYAGLRLGELRALRREDVDLAAGTIEVNHGWDQYDGRQDPKSRSGRRRVPIAGVLREHLIEASATRSHGLLFGRTPDLPFSPATIANRADRAWRLHGLDRITLHDCRHTFASFMIAAGVNAKALQTFMGHASIAITMDRYGQLFPGAEAEAATLLNAYLAQAYDRARAANAVEPEPSVPSPSPPCGEVVGKSRPLQSGVERP